MAEAAGISFDALKLEVNKAFKSRVAREKKQQEKIDLTPAKNLQPKSRNIRYDNMKSAMAEETLLAMVLKEPTLLDVTAGLSAVEFSSKRLGRADEQLRRRYGEGLEVSVAVLADFDSEEMSHLAGISQRHTGPVDETALRDCVRIIQSEHQASTVASDDDLMALRNKLKERKGM